LAVVALGLAIYVLLRHDRDPVRYVGSQQRGLASEADVSRLASRVNHLDGALAALRSSAGGIGSLPARVGTLERAVKQLVARPTGTNSTQAIAQLSSRVNKLASQVSQLQSNQTQTQTQTTTTTTSGG
jgi:outer membrane murein-binding lipoprotein Lpp